MDELEFRRRIFADPDSIDPALHGVAIADSAKHQFFTDTKRLNNQIKLAIDIPVPEDLADKLIWQGTLREHAKQKTRARWHIAMAASIAFTLGIAVTLYNPQHIDLGDAALAHMDYAQTERPMSATPVSLEKMNAKLATIGARLNSEIGRVYVANYCVLDGVKALHLIVDNEFGPVSVFVMPNDGSAEIPQRFANDTYDGKGFRTQNASVMVVGNKHADVGAVSQKVMHNLI